MKSSIGMLFLITLCLQVLLTVLRIVLTHVLSGAIESGSFFSPTPSSIKYQVNTLADHVLVLHVHLLHYFYCILPTWIALLVTQIHLPASCIHTTYYFHKWI